MGVLEFVSSRYVFQYGLNVTIEERSSASCGSVDFLTVRLCRRIDDSVHGSNAFLVSGAFQRHLRQRRVSRERTPLRRDPERKPLGPNRYFSLFKKLFNPVHPPVQLSGRRRPTLFGFAFIPLSSSRLAAILAEACFEDKERKRMDPGSYHLDLKEKTISRQNSFILRATDRVRTCNLLASEFQIHYLRIDESSKRF